MYIQMFKNSLIFLLILMLVSCAAPALTPRAADIEKEEQAVYAFFVNGDMGIALILQDTSSNISKEDPQKEIDNIKSGMKGISQETIDNYLKRNAQPSQLSPDMDLGVKYALLSTDELGKISSQPNWGKLLNEKYPNSHGYTIFSRVGFNNTLDQAVVYVGKVGGPMMGAGYFYLMEKKDGQWVIKEQIMVWIS